MDPQWEFTQHFIGSAERPSGTLPGWIAPSLAARGWIPFASLQDELPSRSFFREEWSNSFAMRQLFGSGNERPANEFNGRGDFIQSLGLKDFRSMLAIDEPKLYCAPDGTPRLFTCWLGHQPGFTPMRGRNATWHSPSHDAIADYSIHASNQEVTIDYWMLFRLSKLADLLGVALIHHSAPYATIRIILTISTGGNVRVRFRSSFIPSQHFYAGWRLVGKHDMIDCTEDDYWGFIKAGKRRNAPEADRFEMELEAKALAVEV